MKKDELKKIRQKEAERLKEKKIFLLIELCEQLNLLSPPALSEEKLMPKLPATIYSVNLRWS